ncbi:MAG: LytTR family DNA-binding domain-containing protein [Bacteroidota bacterium]
MPDRTLEARLRVVVVDDEPPARRKLAAWLERDAEVEIVALCANGYEALDVLAEGPVDVLFLDVQMPELSGFDVLAQRPPGPAPLVVFATAFDHYAVRAFEHHAADYLLKPYDYARFSATLAHVKERHRHRQAREVQDRLGSLLDAVQPPRPYLDRLAVKHADRVELVSVDQVDWIRAEGNYVLVRAGGREHLIRERLSKVASTLDPRRFPRIHRSTIVNLDRVAALHPASHGDYTVVLRDGTELAMSRTYREALREVLQIGF